MRQHIALDDLHDGAMFASPDAAHRVEDLGPYDQLDDAYEAELLDLQLMELLAEHFEYGGPEDDMAALPVTPHERQFINTLRQLNRRHAVLMDPARATSSSKGNAHAHT